MRKAARNAEPEVPTAEWENLGTNDAAATQALLSLSKVAFQPDEDLESVDMIAMLEEELDETYRGVTQLTNELEQARKHLEKLSFYDDLTGLANRALFYDRLEQGCELAKREGRLLPILMMDLDRFKEINDTMGHDIGDQVLQEVAKRLKETLRHSDTVARLGGDEFAALLPSALEQEGVDIVVQKLVDAVGKPIAVGGEMVDVGISIGVALYPVHGEDGVITLSNADAAMYSAKKDGCGFIIYGSDGTAEEIQKSTLASQLRAGISKNQLFLEYQPKINLVTGEVAGVEALVRWKHPEFGLISPAEFIPAAERTGVIKPLTLNVMEQAMEQAVIWQRAENPLNLSVNVSARLLNDWELPDLIIR
ncbi:MAG: diguanylate cyclase, partial [Hyphomicrobiales bacterium]